MKNGKLVKFEYYERTIKSPFTIDADFESILGQETIKSKIHMCLIQINVKSCSLYLWLQTSMYCADDQFSKPFMMLFMGMLEESKYYIHVMEKHFNKELFMTKDCEIFESSAK